MKYIVEHMEEGFSDWVRLEYLSIAQEVGPGNFYLSSVPENADIPPEFARAGIKITGKDVVNFAEIEPEFDPKRVVLLDPAANSDLSPEDADKFDFFLFGGILGDHPPRDRTGELRKYGFVGRRLGPVQLTTDTAVRVTQLVVEDAKPLDKIDYIDFPELKFNKNESTEMPFRYVKDKDGKPIMPKGMFELIKKDTEKSLF